LLSRVSEVGRKHATCFSSLDPSQSHSEEGATLAASNLTYAKARARDSNVFEKRLALGSALLHMGKGIKILTMMQIRV